MRLPRAIFIGASAGGIGALRYLFERLPKLFPFPIIAVQHLPPSATFDCRLIFGGVFSGRVYEAVDKMYAESGNLYLAPPAYHLLVESDLSLALTQESPVCFARPSIDVLFDSAAESLGPGALGILLTGANDDGTQGLARIQRAGGTTIVQDPFDAENPSMPQAALNMLKPDHVMTLDSIARYLAELAERVSYHVAK